MASMTCPPGYPTEPRCRVHARDTRSAVMMYARDPHARVGAMVLSVRRCSTSTTVGHLLHHAGHPQRDAALLAAGLRRHVRPAPPVPSHLTLESPPPRRDCPPSRQSKNRGGVLSPDR